MQHVHDLWFERVVRRPSSRDYLEVSHVLVVVADLLTDLDITDSDALDYLETELRRQYAEANDIRFVQGAHSGVSAGQGGSPPRGAAEPPAAAAGLEDGDIVQQIDGKVIDEEHPLDATLSQFSPGDTVAVTVLRDGQTLTIDVTLGTRPPDL